MEQNQQMSIREDPCIQCQTMKVKHIIRKRMGHPNSAEVTLYIKCVLLIYVRTFQLPYTMGVWLIYMYGMQCYTDNNWWHLLASVSSCVASLKSRNLDVSDGGYRSWSIGFQVFDLYLEINIGIIFGIDWISLYTCWLLVQCINSYIIYTQGVRSQTERLRSRVGYLQRKELWACWRRSWQIPRCVSIS